MPYDCGHYLREAIRILFEVITVAMAIIQKPAASIVKVQIIWFVILLGTFIDTSSLSKSSFFTIEFYIYSNCLHMHTKSTATATTLRVCCYSICLICTTYICKKMLCCLFKGSVYYLMFQYHQQGQ